GSRRKLPTLLELRCRGTVERNEPLGVGTGTARRHGNEHGELPLRGCWIVDGIGVREANPANTVFFVDLATKNVRRLVGLTGLAWLTDCPITRGGNIEQGHGVETVLGGKRASLTES